MMRRRWVALTAAVLALALSMSLAPAAGATGVDLTCSFALVKMDPNVVNIAYPDQAALYYILPYQALPGTQIEIDGVYPHARYMSFTAYDPAERPLDAINDIHVAPNPGSANPFIAGTSRDTADGVRHYSVFVQFGAQPATPAPNTIYTGTGQDGLPNLDGTLIYRIYLPDDGRDNTGGVGLPTVTLEPSGTVNAAQPASPCNDLTLPTSSLSLNGAVATADGVPAIESSGDAFGMNPPRWSKFLNVAYSLFQVATGSPDAESVFAPLDGEIGSAAQKVGGNGGFLSNLDNAYVAAPIDRGYGQVLVTRERVPTFADTRGGAPVMPTAQVRYWSMCENDPFTERFIACDTDDETEQSPTGYATYVVSTPAERPTNATTTCGVNWLPWGPDPEGLLILRNMLPEASFTESIQDATLGSEASTMGAYYPVSRYYTTAGYEKLGCTGAGSSASGTGPAQPSKAATARCPKPTGRLHGATLGPLSLGITRAAARRRLTRETITGDGVVDYCLAGGQGIRGGYPSPPLLRPLAKSVRARLRGRIVLALTANPYYALSGARPGMALSMVKRHLAIGKPIAIGADDWYVIAGHQASGILKVGGAIVEEVGAAAPELTRDRRAQRRLLSSFRTA